VSEIYLAGLSESIPTKLQQMSKFTWLGWTNLYLLNLLQVATGKQIYLAGPNKSMPIKSIATGEQIYLLKREKDKAHLDTSENFPGFKRKA
jgi:hypothetical protein